MDQEHRDLPALRTRRRVHKGVRKPNRETMSHIVNRERELGPLLREDRQMAKENTLPSYTRRRFHV